MLKYKHIEAAREVRLWLAQVIVPLVGVMALSPDARKTAGHTIQGVKNLFKRNRK